MVAESVIVSEAIGLGQEEDRILETVVHEQSGLVYRIAYSVLRNPADAEDATQEVFLRVLRYRKKLNALEDTKAWVARIAWRVAVERRQSLQTSAGRVHEYPKETVSNDLPADHVLLDREEKAMLDQMIQALPSQLRDVLVLSSIQEIAPREVGSMLGISEAAVRSRAFRARGILREKLLALSGSRT